MTSADRRAVNRFVLTASLLLIFALFRWREGVWRVAALLFLSASILDAVIAFVRGDQLKSPAITYWDEAGAFLLLSGLAAAIWMESSR